MKKLTKAQRLEAYTYCYLNLTAFPLACIYNMLQHWAACGNGHYAENLCELLPEVKPHEKLLWLGMGMKRLRAIETCIRLCEQSKD